MQLSYFFTESKIDFSFKLSPRERDSLNETSILIFCEIIEIKKKNKKKNMLS